MKHKYSITGMTCESCAEKIKHALAKLPAIITVEVSLKDKKADITMTEHVELEELNKTLEPLKKYKLHLEQVQMKSETSAIPEKSLKTYWPLILVVLYILFGTLHLSWTRGQYLAMEIMADFMGLFFLAFGFFKLLDVKGFASSYLSYDIPTKTWPTWGYIYPFVEIGLGMLHLHRWWPIATGAITIVVMGLSIIGVIQSVLQKRKIKCVCLGTGFNLPMSTVTITEDTLMIGMAAVMLWINLT